MQNNNAISTQHASDSELQEMLGLAAGSSVNNYSADPFPDIDLDTFGHADQSPDAADDSIPPIHHHDAALPAVQPSIESPLHEEQTPHDGGVPPAGIGAGPLPTGYGIQLPSNAGSTLTDFTKRRNWSQRVVEEIKDFLHILSPDCRIMYVSPSARTLTGHEPNELVGKLMAKFIHTDDCGMYMREFNESIASGHAVRFFYRFLKADGSYTIFESHGHPHFSADVADIGGSGHGVAFCRGFFMMSRPYPTKSAGMLDSFLEHKIENERLKKRIADLKREELEDSQQQYMGGPGFGNQGSSGGYGQLNQSGSSASMTPVDQQHPGDLLFRGQSNSASGESLYLQNQHAGHYPQPHSGAFPESLIVGTHDYNGMPPPAKPSDANYALTQRNLDEALAASIPDSINDKMARYEGINHLEGIEMLTGLRYREGERSKGISTGAKSPALEHGSYDFLGHKSSGVNNAGAANANQGANAGGRRTSGSPGVFGDPECRKKLKLADEHVCTDCGTLDSPEWRRGPMGPKSLCNACGLRWAKQEKKRANAAGAGAGEGGGGKPVKGKNATEVDGGTGDAEPGHESVPASPFTPATPNYRAMNTMRQQQQQQQLPALNTRINGANTDLDQIHSGTYSGTTGLPYSANAKTSPMDMSPNATMSMNMGAGMQMTPQMQAQLQAQIHGQMQMRMEQQQRGNGSANGNGGVQAFGKEPQRR